MGLHRPRGQVELGGDLRAGQPLTDLFGDPELGRGEASPTGRRPAPGSRYPQSQVMLPQPRSQPAFNGARAKLTRPPRGPARPRFAPDRDRPPAAAETAACSHEYSCATMWPARSLIPPPARRCLPRCLRHRWRLPGPAESPRRGQGPDRGVHRPDRPPPGGADRHCRPALPPGQHRDRRAVPTADDLITDRPRPFPPVRPRGRDCRAPPRVGEHRAGDAASRFPAGAQPPARCSTPRSRRRAALVE